jgi:RNA polymerase sigma-70 factor, ECF subfamily
MAISAFPTLVSSSEVLPARLSILGCDRAKCRKLKYPKPKADLSEESKIRLQEGQRSTSTCDFETIRQARLGDAKAWEVLVRQNIGWVFSTCRRWVRSVEYAEDLTQEVFLRVFQSLHSYNGEVAGFRAWLSQITRNLLIDNYRRSRMERCTLSYDSGDEWMKNVLSSIHACGLNPESNIKDKEQKAALQEAFNKLRPELRKAVLLHDMLELTYEEISAMLNTPVGTVKSRVNRGRLGLVPLIRHRLATHFHFSPGASAVA